MLIHCCTPTYSRLMAMIVPIRCMSSSRKKNHYYNILGLQSTASQKQIKTAYYSLSKKYHPDVATDKTSHVMFMEITEAYEVLGNINKRRLYDKGMFSHRDQRVYEDREDYTQAYKEKTAQSPFARGDRPPPPTGRSSIYNFDEFYKQHYNEMRERRGREYREFQEYKAQMESFRAQQRSQRLSSPLMWTLCLTFAFVVIWITDNRDLDMIRNKYKKSDSDR